MKMVINSIKRSSSMREQLQLGGFKVTRIFSPIFECTGNRRSRLIDDSETVTNSEPCTNPGDHSKYFRSRQYYAPKE